MNEYEVVATPNVSRYFHVTAESPERAVELIAEGEQSLWGEKVVHMRDKDDGYDIAWVKALAAAEGEQR